MDDKLLKSFQSAALNTFKDMFGVDAKAQAPVELSANDEHGWDITGLLGIAGQVQGVFAFRLTSNLATALLNKSGVDVAIDGDRRALEGGLVGEVTNIIAGSASSGMSGYEFEIAPPVVVRGPNHKINWPAIAPVFAVGFATPDGAFEIDICAKL
jgi:chemotaxis protein CheX